MAVTVIEAFEEFLSQAVNLDSEVSKSAKRSRDWLVDRIHSFPENDESFPRLYNGMDIFFGSFERKTKKRELDDIDLMICLSAQGVTYSEWGKKVYIGNTNEGSPLHELRFDDGVFLNSKRVINKFVSALGGIPQYDKAEMHRRGEAATLSLKSYQWVFDIVPCFMTTEESNGKTYYLIPDGDGHWQKTDPRIDRGRVERLAALRGAKMLDVIRLVKYWNCRPTMPTMGSYLLENMVLDYYETNDCSRFPDIEFIKVVKHIEYAILKSVDDPKGIQGDLNTVGWFDRFKISSRCDSDYNKCMEARDLEKQGEQRKSIAKWCEVFGDSFPTFS
ncbi:nucleotidyltransferase [Massilia sp. 9I]|uniref:nucleotidyltransferase n=1 Tax=Massilia sp. 9I TaxID=2653152 RepID=UPI0012EF7E00|nr:nucleotidyltransferase [Massilia sp. 9I]VXC04781.1 Nucleotidyltransferase [Massilia sp. 9I]